MPPVVEFRGVAKRYRANEVLTGVDLAVEPGGFAVVYGPPTAGKSVLMRLLMGLERPDGGQVWLRGEDATAVPAAERNIGYVPQSFALYPHLSVHDNIAYPLTLARVNKREIEPVVQRVAGMLKITDLLGKRPDQLSGGQKQRVAIARGIAKQSELFVLDDPLAGLDFKLREQLVDDLRDLQQEARATFLYTTSDPLEALALADHLAVLDGGRIVEAGDPERLYARPTNARTMALLGFPRANLLPGDLYAADGGLRCRAGAFDFPVRAEGAAGSGAVLIGIRPEDIAVGAGGANGNGRVAADGAGEVRAAARVLLREDLGGEEIVYLDCAGTPLTTVVRHHAIGADIGEGAVAAVRPGDIALFAPGDGRLIGRGAAAGGA